MTDVIVAWLQHDYGQLGRPSEAIAHALVAAGHRVAYVEPFAGAATGQPAELSHRVDRGLHLFSGRGTPPAGSHEVAQAVCATAGLQDPVLLCFGVSEQSWWLHAELAPVCSHTVLVTYDKLAEWDAMAPRRGLLERIRALLIGSSDVVCGLSLGSIDDVPDAVYVGHGVDEAWRRPGVDLVAEPADLAAVARPRAVYVGALSMRFHHEAVRALARSGVEVVLVGIAAPPALLELCAREPHLHHLGGRAPDRTPGYLRFADVGIVPHTNEPFTRSMEPHKAYNYAAAGLRTVTLHTEHAPALDGWLEATGDVDAFVAGVHRAIAAGRLDGPAVAAARELSWDRVAERLLEAAAVRVTQRALRSVA